MTRGGSVDGVEWAEFLKGHTNRARQVSTGKRRLTAVLCQKGENGVSEKQRVLESASHAVVPERQSPQLDGRLEDKPTTVVSEFRGIPIYEQCQQIRQFIQ